MVLKPVVRINPFVFGKQLILTQDLDPVYVLIHGAYMNGEERSNWLLAYFCFYHVGTASWIADEAEQGKLGYWNAMKAAARSSKFPRGTERRHFRAANAEKSIASLMEHGNTAKEIIYKFHHFPDGSPVPTLNSVMERVKQVNGFGDWIAFKVADMLERLGIADIIFVPADVFHMFDSPVKGAQELWRLYGGELNELDESFTVTSWAYKRIISQLGHLKAPPTNDRTINIQEVETILCKWKSHLGGHYEPGHDIKEIGKALEVFDTPTVQRLKRVYSQCLL